MRYLFALLAGCSVFSTVSSWTEIHHKPFLTKNIDAIVQPGLYTSHMHTFFGSDAITNVLPTSSQLQQGCYSGENGNDFSVYWIPTLYYVDGETFTEVPIFRFSTYYVNSRSEIPIPLDFAMISGNASAQSQDEVDAQPRNNLEWFCEGSDDREPDIAKFPTKTCNQNLKLSLVFPSCVNTDDISQYDFPDQSGKCPAGMKAIPQLRYGVWYNTKSVAPGGWDGDAPFQLSCGAASGNGYCGHGDFINGWFQDSLDNMMIRGGGGYNDGQFISGAHASALGESTCTPTDADPDKGTSDYLESLEMM
ncbi:hypothetical protein BU24DRAFT_352199 [Aaosphaeria arxii CBS 175.79]|uniref:DUF1996 domain-containing protein n=1 Tax=Aaosphaeria arxii CBS 175.79 TaxID=1450172 RepID=A0A6A5XI12_9PLEO|nr:uncharacterized protein BU24DRAFT_352199 [Aaosphaeria arxii CBS 175.79]KAF2012905.1 hypothetical protein BU24DRAFT_352199 [Aaosphaeria arxii CBS 175.79]